MKKILKLTAFLILLWVVFLFYSYKSALNYALSPLSTDRISVQIDSGSSAHEVAAILKEKGLIQNENAFLFYLYTHEGAEHLKAGHYVFLEGDTLPTFASALTSGKTTETVITFLEGWTAREMGEKLEKEGVGTAADYLKCAKECSFKNFAWLPSSFLEGFLYPETYFVQSVNFDPKTLIARQLQVFEDRFVTPFSDDIKKSGHSLQDLVTLASIVEREESDPQERPIVAGILWKRLSSHMMLGADATVLYALGRTQGGLNYDDLQTDSPYNTRKHAGLPPTPISNPSLSSLKAALHPKVTSYLYYLHDAEGQVHYASSLEEHNANKRKYLR